MIVVTVNNMKFDLLFCVGVCSKIVYNYQQNTNVKCNYVIRRKMI